MFNKNNFALPPLNELETAHFIIRKKFIKKNELQNPKTLIVLHIEKALINDRLLVSKVSGKFCIPAIHI